MWPKLITNRYQTQLGEPWVVLFGTPVYRPWRLFEWWYHYEANAPDVFDRVSMLAGASGCYLVRRFDADRRANPLRSRDSGGQISGLSQSR